MFSINIILQLKIVSEKKKDVPEELLNFAFSGDGPEE